MPWTGAKRSTSGLERRAREPGWRREHDRAEMRPNTPQTMTSDAIVIDSFRISILTAILLKLLLEALNGVEQGRRLLPSTGEGGLQGARHLRKAW